MIESGVIVVNKPPKLSSNAVVVKIKKLLGANKVGHLGTLDPFATGVLPITINKATRLFDYFLTKTKTYIATMKFGVETDTFDIDGNITKTDNVIVEVSTLELAMKCFIGKMDQLPPQFSAKKINGKKAYEYARKGEVVSLNTKQIEIYDLRLLRQIETNIFEVEIECSAGTYIRSLCRDLATHIGTCGMLINLVRTKCGVFNINSSYSFEDIQSGNFSLMSIENCLPDIKKCYIDKSELKDILDGKKVNCVIDEKIFLLLCENEVLGLATNFDGHYKIVANFYGGLI